MDAREGRPPRLQEKLGRHKVIVTRDTEPHSGAAAHDSGRHCGRADNESLGSVVMERETEKLSVTILHRRQYTLPNLTAYKLEQRGVAGERVALPSPLDERRAMSGSK